MLTSRFPLVITEFDRVRLEKLVEHLRVRADVDVQRADDLEHELDRAEIVPPTDVPPHVVTMNSEVRLVDLDTGERLTVSVVFPAAAAPKAGRISVLAPLGLALLGVREAEEIEWNMPGGARRLRVLRVLYQPEAAGRFDL